MWTPHTLGMAQNLKDEGLFPWGHTMPLPHCLWSPGRGPRRSRSPPPRRSCRRGASCVPGACPGRGPPAASPGASPSPAPAHRIRAAGRMEMEKKCSNESCNGNVHKNGRFGGRGPWEIMHKHINTYIHTNINTYKYIHTYKDCK